jgi:DNA-binding PadR family transcriptional regulator
MKRTATLEQFEQLVLAAVATLEDAYGVTIHDKAEEFSGRPLQFGPIYSTLNRLENKGYIRSSTAAGTPKRGGRPKRNYKIEPAGESALKDSARTADRVFGAVKTLWEIPYGTGTASDGSDIK